MLRSQEGMLIKNPGPLDELNCCPLELRLHLITVSSWQDRPPNMVMNDIHPARINNLSGASCTLNFS